MADAAEDPIHTWQTISESAEVDTLMRVVMDLGVNFGCDVSVTLRVPGDDRYFSVSFGHMTEEDDLDGA